MHSRGRFIRLMSVAFAVVATVLVGQQVLGLSETKRDDSFQTSEVDSSSGSIRYSDLPSIAIGELPFEALETLERIDNDEPHPYGKDGSTFQNREAILPDQQIGHYKEFTVNTPGISDRGARRIVAGDDGERFYTADHYVSFSEIIN